MKKWFALTLLVVVLNITNSPGQEIRQSQSTNNSSVDKSVISGHFSIDKDNRQSGVVEHINVNYALSPVPVTSVLNINLRTPAPLMLTADIVDINGRKLIHWEPASKSYTYSGVINIDQLVPGNYKVDIYSEFSPAFVYSINFQKVQVK